MWVVVNTMLLLPAALLPRKKPGTFTFMLPRVVTDFFFNNKPDALIIKNLFCHKILHVSSNFVAHHQDFSIYFRHW